MNPPINVPYSGKRRLLFCGGTWGGNNFGMENLSLGGIFHPRPGGIDLFLLELTNATSWCVCYSLQFEVRQLVRVLLCGATDRAVGICLQHVPLIGDQTFYCNNWCMSIIVLIGNYSPPILFKTNHKAWGNNYDYQFGYLQYRYGRATHGCQLMYSLAIYFLP